MPMSTGLTRTRAPYWDVEKLHSKILYVVHNACHHVASVGIKQEDRKLYATGRHFIMWLQDQMHPHLHHMFVHDPSPFLACIQVFRRESWELPRLNLAPGFPLKTTKGHKKSPDAVTVLTATITCNVADNEVRPLTVFAPGWEIVLPGDMLKKIGVWSMLMTKRTQQLITVTLGLANLIKSIASLRRTSGGRWHSCVTCRSEILFVLQKRRTAKSFAFSVLLRKAALTSHAFRVNNCTDTMKPCSRSSKNHLKNCSSTEARTDCLQRVVNDNVPLQDLTCPVLLLGANVEPARVGP